LAVPFFYAAQIIGRVTSRKSSTAAAVTGPASPTCVGGDAFLGSIGSGDITVLALGRRRGVKKIGCRWSRL
jgi:hypothetical protein